MAQQAERNRGSGVFLSILSAAILAGVMLVAGRSVRAQDPYKLGDFSNLDPVALEQAYSMSGDTKDLVSLLCSLCYQAEVVGDTAAEVKIKNYGSALYDQAKEGRISLDESMPTEMLSEELIRLIRKYGAR